METFVSVITTATLVIAALALVIAIIPILIYVFNEIGYFCWLLKDWIQDIIYKIKEKRLKKVKKIKQKQNNCV